VSGRKDANEVREGYQQMTTTK